MLKVFHLLLFSHELGICFTQWPKLPKRHPCGKCRASFRQSQSCNKMDDSSRPQGYTVSTWALDQNKITKHSLSRKEMSPLLYIYIRFLMALKLRYLKSVNYKIVTWHANKPYELYLYSITMKK